jgi:hypothetical protein
VKPNRITALLRLLKKKNVLVHFVECVVAIMKNWDGKKEEQLGFAISSPFGKERFYQAIDMWEKNILKLHLRIGREEKIKQFIWFLNMKQYTMLLEGAF